MRVKRGELTAEQKKQALKGGAAALALAAMVAIVPVWEGRSLAPYDDVRKIKTVCDGETEVEMRRYTPAECDAILERRLKYFRDMVLKRNPRLVNHPLTWASHGSFAYNTGVGNYNKSSVARLFQQGAYIQSCKAMGRYKFAAGHVYHGLLLRRTGDNARLGEIELCLQGLKK
jgi:lysozyme